MKARYCSSLLAFFCVITGLFIHTTSDVFPSLEDPSSGCALPFSSNLYKPSGDCLARKKKRVNFWGSIPSNLCCRNALVAFSEALAQRAKKSSNSNIFLTKDEWKNCRAPFQEQQSVSLHSCGFDVFAYGTSSKCSSLSLYAVQKEKEFQDVMHSCSRLNSSFDNACSNCTQAILKTRNSLWRDTDGDDYDNHGNAFCYLAVVTSIAATWNDTTLTSHLFSCLDSCDAYDPGYFRIKNVLAKAILAVILVVITLMLVLALVKYVGTKKRGRRKRKTLKPGKEIITWSGLYTFSKAEIENALNYDTERKYLGRGSAGQVYKGVLPSGQVVAIKHIYKSSNSDSFTREIEGLSRIRHPNLVCLFGCCIEGGEQYLVYDYCPAGNLAQHLLRKDSALTWDKRVKIMRDCALALRYLHHYIDGCIVHRDIKLTNILLTENLEPKLSDFGLARMLGMEESKVFTDVRGTIGYMDPEYMSNAKLTCASDIYSFGIVALQILSGQKVIELDLDARDQLTRKAKDVSLRKRPVSDFEDPRLNGKVNRVDFDSILQIAVLCVAKSSKGRPTIDVVFDEIDKCWKNTMAEMRSKKPAEMDSSGTPQSKSSEVIPV